jgi:protein-disulfide isomerase
MKLQSCYMLTICLCLNVGWLATAQTTESTVRTTVREVLEEKHGSDNVRRLTFPRIYASANPQYLELVARRRIDTQTLLEFVSIEKHKRFLAESKMYPLASGNRSNVGQVFRRVFDLAKDAEIEVTPSEESTIPGFRKGIINFGPKEARRQQRYYIDAEKHFLVLGMMYTIRTPREIAEKLTEKDNPTIGNNGAKLTIVEFSDFECPACAEADGLFFAEVMPRHARALRVVFKDFPLFFHPWAHAAALAARCVFTIAPDSYVDYRKAIFQHQETITPDTAKSRLLDLADGLNIDKQRMTSCIDGGEVEKDVQLDLAQGYALEISQTPTFYINGQPLVDYAPAAFERVIQDAMRGDVATTSVSGVHHGGSNSSCCTLTQ